jgi:hypothetical protein
VELLHGKYDWKMTQSSAQVWLFQCTHELEGAFRKPSHEQALIVLQNVMINSAVYVIDIFLQDICYI